MVCPQSLCADASLSCRANVCVQGLCVPESKMYKKKKKNEIETWFAESPETNEEFIDNGAVWRISFTFMHAKRTRTMWKFNRHDMVKIQGWSENDVYHAHGRSLREYGRLLPTNECACFSFSFYMYNTSAGEW